MRYCRFGRRFSSRRWRCFESLERTLADALEEASEVGFLERPDRGIWDVPSVAEHPQNAHRSGFYPITRVLADLWRRIAAQYRERARTLAVGWKKSPFLLAQRLYLYALSSQNIFTAREAVSAVLTLSDEHFWLSETPGRDHASADRSVERVQQRRSRSYRIPPSRRDPA